MLNLRRIRDRMRRKPSSSVRPIVREVETPPVFERHCFICGLHRSGTTMLETLIQARCDVAVLRAPVPENEGQHLQDVYPAAWRHGGPGAFAFAPQMRPAAPPPEEAARLRARLMRQWGGWIDRPARVLVEKSPPNLTRIAWLRAVFPGAAFLIITRDPRAVAAATRKWSAQELPALLRHWEVAHRAALDDRGLDCHVLRYEDLCADPDGRLKAAISAQDLPLRPAPLPLPARFAAIRDSNRKYLDRHDWSGFTPGPAAAAFGYG